MSQIIARYAYSLEYVLVHLPWKGVILWWV